MKAKLHYIYDPMCSWCWGFAPTWKRLQQELTEHVEIVYGLGGLAEDSTQVMSLEMQDFLQQTWRKIARQLDTKFNFDFWLHCQPRRSTYLSCRAALIARSYAKEQMMLSAIQHAYYLQAKNPSDIETLHTLAMEIGLDGRDFLTQINSLSLDQALKIEIAEKRKMPINGFPSLVLENNEKYTAIPIDYKNWQISFKHITAFLNVK